MEPESSLPASQEPSFCPYTEPDQCSLCPFHRSWRSILIFYFHLLLGLPDGFFPAIFPIKILYTLLSHTCYISQPRNSGVYTKSNLGCIHGSYRGADKALAQQGRKQPTATEL